MVWKGSNEFLWGIRGFYGWQEDDLALASVPSAAWAALEVRVTARRKSCPDNWGVTARD